MITLFISKRYVKQRAFLALVLIIALLSAYLPFLPAEPAAAAASGGKHPTELINKRTENSKTFDNRDGTYTTDVYSSPVHYRADNQWQDINSDIKSDGNGGYNNSANQFQLHFAGKGNDSDLTSVTYKGFQVKYSLDKIPSLGSNYFTQTKDVTPTVDQDKITYPDIFPSVDLRQTVVSDGLKEDLILKEYTGKNSFAFSLKMEGVYAVKEDDGSISFYQESEKGQPDPEKVFSIPKPFMEDSHVDPHSGEPARSDQVTQDIVQKGSNFYLTITADSGWLQSSERQYPVYIDPTTKSLSANADSYVMSAYPTTNYNADWNATDAYYQLKSGYYDSTTGTCYSYLKFDLSSLAGKLVTSATLNAYTKHSYYSGTANSVWLNTVTSSWSETGVTWNKRPASTSLTSDSVHQGQWASFTVTKPVAGWCSSPAQGTNYGFELHENGNGQTYWKKFAARENSSNKPYLSVTYSDPPATPTGTAHGNAANSKTGYCNLSWTAVSGATGYEVLIWNGTAYETWSVGNVTSWSTQNKKIWPTASEIAAGRYTLHHDSAGTELADDPSPVYHNSGNSTYYGKQNYWFEIKALTSYGRSANCTAFKPTLPDRSAPPAVASVGISGANGTTGSGDKASVTASWTGVGDTTTGSNSGTSYYKLNLVKTNLQTGAVTTSTVNVTNSGSGIAHSYTFTSQPDYTKYQAQVIVYDKEGNYSGTVSSATWSSADRTNPSVSFTAPASNATVSGTVSITATGADETAFDHMSLSARKYGTNDSQALGTKTGTSAAWTWDTAKLSDGEYVLTLTGYDTQGNTAATQRNVKVANILSGMGLDHWGTVENDYGQVNIANGNFIVTQDDINLPGLGLGTSLSRIYNSQIKTNGSLGWGWRLDIPELAQYSDGSVVITDGDGFKHPYTANADGSYKRPAGSYDTLTKNTDDTFSLKSTDGQQYVFDTADKKVTLQDKNNNTVVYQYDSANRLTKITDPTGRATTLSYDQATGRLTSVTDYGSRTWAYSYDASGNLAKVTDPLSHQMSFTYDSDHNLTAVTDANGNTTSFAYSGGKLASVQDPLSHTTSYSYDTTGKQFTETDPRSNATSYTYDDNWDVTSITDALNNSTTYTYDANFNQTSATDARGGTTAYTYDEMGNVLSETDPMNQTTSYTYDQDNNMLSKTDALGHATNYSYDANGNCLSDGDSTYTYNDDGTTASGTDANGNTTTYAYDAHGNQTSATDALDNTTSYDYDSLGRKTAETDASGNTTSYSYDALGRTLSVTVPDDQITTYTYDANGNKLKTTDAAGQVTEWEYDALDRVTKTTQPDGSTESSSYDANGNVLSQTAADGKVTSNEYDALNRQTKTTDPDGKVVSYTYDANGNKTGMTDATGSTAYVYNADNFLIKETSPSGKVTTYDYDANNQLTGRTVNGRTTTYKFDGKGNLQSLTADSQTTTYDYDAGNNRTAANYANNAKINYSFDAANKLTNIKNIGSSGSTFADFDYTYYDNGLIKTVTDGNGTTAYEYDGQNRLTKVTDPTGKVTSYTYDEAGNRLTEENTVNGSTTTTSYSYDAAANQLTNITKPDGSKISYTYDDKGNTLTKTDSSGTTTYTYNSSNQLTKVAKPNGDVIEFAYDGQNRRISQTVNGAVTNYEYDDNLLSAETDVSGSVIATYTYDDKGAPVSVTKGGQTYYYQYNGHGDVIALTDAGGNVAATFAYDAWGNITDKTGTIDTPFGYAGQFGYVYDQQIGLYFLQSRYYDPEIGRFTSKDRFQGFEEDPASQNPYTYAENDPVNKVDPNGCLARKEISVYFINFIIKQGKIAKKHRHQFYPKKLLWFRSMVANQKPWDIKWHMKGKYRFMGKNVDGQDLGNILYGYVGLEAGFSKTLLRSAAGVYQIFRRTSSWRFYKTYFDDPRDQDMINWGFRLYYLYN